MPLDPPSSSVLFRPWAAVCLVLAAGLALFLVKQTAPSDFMDKDQARPAAYALDIRANGNWLVQHDPSGDVMSKPPVSTWVIVALSLPFEHFGRFQFYVPNYFAHAAITLLILAWGSTLFGPRAAVFASLIYLMNPLTYRHLQLARTDSMFTLFIFLSLLLAWRAWTQRGSWTPFWIVAAIATLTKGPLGILFVFGGLLVAWWWERRQARPDVPPLRGEHLVGSILFLLIAGGWFLASWLALQDALVEKMIGRELLGKAVKSDVNGMPLTKPWGPTVYFVTRFLPWSPLAIYAFWRILKSPAVDDTVRRFERALLGVILFTGVIFSLAPHQRADHLMPLIPMASLLTGRELARLLAPVPLPVQRIAVSAALVVAMAGTFFYSHRLMADSRLVEYTRRAEAIATSLHEYPVPPAMFTYAPGVHHGYQYYLNTNRRWVPFERVAQLAVEADIALLVTNDGWDELEPILSPFVQHHVEFEAPLLHEPQTLRLVRLEAPLDRDLDPRPMGLFDGSLSMRLSGGELTSHRGGLWIRATHDHVALSITNAAEHDVTRRLRIPGVVPAVAERITIPAGGTWSREWPRSPRRPETSVPPPALGLILLGVASWMALAAGAVWAVRRTKQSVEQAPPAA